MPKVQLPHASNPRAHGARPGRVATVKRDKQVLIRLTDEEFESIQAAADAADSAIAHWCRAALLSASRQRVPGLPAMGPITIQRSHRSNQDESVDA